MILQHEYTTINIGKLELDEPRLWAWVKFGLYIMLSTSSNIFHNYLMRLCLFK
jgi:hypothetical protein